MFSDKPPLQQLVYQGSPGKASSLLSKDQAAHPRPSASENCDPNLHKIDLSATFFKEESSCSVLKDRTKVLRGEQVKSEAAGAAAVESSVCEGDEQINNVHKFDDQINDIHKCGGVGQQLKSPTKPTSSPRVNGGHGHKHFCRSPRCASNNPDYATPAQIQPRKYLISKRHLLPGAICTRDPSTLSSQIPLPPSSTGKPPARPPALSKPPTPFRQLSFKDAAPDHTRSVSADKSTCSVLDTQCGLVTGTTGGNGERSISDEHAISQSESAGVVSGCDTELGNNWKDPIGEKSFLSLACDGEVIQTRSGDTDGGCSPKADAVRTESSCLGGGDSSCSEDRLPGSVNWVEPELCESCEFSAVAGESSGSSARAGQSTPPIAGTSEEPLSVSFCELTDAQGSLDLLSAARSSGSAGLPDVEDVARTLEERLALEKMDVNSPKAQSPRALSTNDDAVDIYDLAASNAGSEATGLEKDYFLQDFSNRCRAENDRFQRQDAIASNFKTLTEENLSEQASEDCLEQAFIVETEDVSGSDVTSCQFAEEPEVRRAAPRHGKTRGRQLWNSECRDSREVVTLRPTNFDKQAGEWMVDSLLEGAVNRMNPSGGGRVRVLVEAFESLMNISEPEPEKRPSRVWCFNRMGKGQVDDDGDEFEEGDQRVDCYEVSGDRLQLRASMRLSLGGATRHGVCSLNEDDDEDNEIQMSSMQKVQDWDDCQPSNPTESDKVVDGEEQNDGSLSHKHEETMSNCSEYSKRSSDGQCKINDNVRSRVKMYNEVKKQLGYNTEDNVKMKIQRYSKGKAFSKSSSVKSETESNPGSAEKNPRVKNTSSEPFRLLTEERGAMKEYQFAKKLEQIFAEEERLRNPIAQGLPWTTDEPQVVPKPPVKQPTKHVDFRHYSDSRAVTRAEFDYYIAERQMYMDMQKEEQERQRQIAEQEEIKRLRREMVPRAQLMPFFDQPFMPSRSSKRLTVPKEPNFKSRQHKRAKCVVWQQGSM